MDELTILIRAYDTTLELIEKEEKFNEKRIKEKGKEDFIAIHRLQKLNEEEKYLHSRILDLENKKNKK